MAAVDLAGDVERRLAEAIVLGVPRTNALLAPAINHFRWFEATKRWDCPGMIREAVDRYRAVSGRDQFLAHPPSRGVAYRLLTDAVAAPDGEHAGAVAALLRDIDAHHPTLRADLDAGTVAAWKAFLIRYNDRPMARLDRRFNMAVRGLLVALVWLFRSWPGRAVLLVAAVGLVQVLPGSLVVVIAWSVSSVIGLLVRRLAR